MLSGSAVRIRPVREDDLEWLVTEFARPSSFGEFEPYFLGGAEALRWRFQEDRLLSSEKTRLVIEDRAGRRIGLASIDELGLDASIVNVNGGAIALGHPLGMSGNRVAITALYELARRGGGTAAVALCGGGGQGDAAILRTL